MNAKTVEEFKSELANQGFDKTFLGDDGCDGFQKSTDKSNYPEQWQLYVPQNPFATDKKWTARHYPQGSRLGNDHDIELTFDN